MPWLLTAFSMAATWVWAPSMFVASEKAYTQGLVGVFWFVVPNVLTLMLFAFFANKMRKAPARGWTFSDYIREKYSKRCHNLFLVESFGLQTMSFCRSSFLPGLPSFQKDYRNIVHCYYGGDGTLSFGVHIRKWDSVQYHYRLLEDALDCDCFIVRTANYVFKCRTGSVV